MGASLSTHLGDNTMKRILLSVGISLLLAGSAEAACPATQPATLVAVGGKLSICSTEATTQIEIEKNGTGPYVQIPLVLAPGVPVDLTGYTQCAAGTMKVRHNNGAGWGPWGASVSATFPGCVAPLLGPPLP